jgi:PKD repeat protein
MPLTSIRRAAVALALFAAVGCTVKSTEPPPLTGPSGLALSLSVNAIPDSINQDGGSQSSIKITAIGPDGKPVAGLPVRLDTVVNGVAQDFGTLSARSVVTNTAGTASVVFTAPPSNGVFGTCSGVVGNCVSIVATPTSTNFATANPEQVQIRLVPTGVILPPATTPTAAFTFSPTPGTVGVPVVFDASTSCGGPLSAAGGCQSTSPLTYFWNFGDGSSGSAAVVSHSFGTAAKFTVTLTVTNDRGVSASVSKDEDVKDSVAPKPVVVFSPAAIRVNETVSFNASASTAGPGRTIRSYDWDFGDGTAHGSGATPTHRYTTANTFAVTLIVTDDLGQQGVDSSKSVKVDP